MTVRPSLVTVPPESGVPYLLVLRGPLGAGKTTIAAALAPRLNAGVVSIDALLERLEWDGGSESLFLRTNRLAVPQALAVLRSGRPVIVEGNFYWKGALDDLIERLGVPHRVLRLEVPLERCVARDAGRPGTFGETATRQVFRKVARVPLGEPIDGSASVVTTVNAILRTLKGWPTPLKALGPTGGGTSRAGRSARTGRRRRRAIGRGRASAP